MGLSRQVRVRDVRSCNLTGGCLILLAWIMAGSLAIASDANTASRPLGGQRRCVSKAVGRVSISNILAKGECPGGAIDGSIEQGGVDITAKALARGAPLRPATTAASEDLKKPESKRKAAGKQALKRGAAVEDKSNTEGRARNDLDGGGGGGMRAGQKDGVETGRTEALRPEKEMRQGRSRKRHDRKWVCNRRGCTDEAKYTNNTLGAPEVCRRHREARHKRSRMYEKWVCRKRGCERYSSYGLFGAMGEKVYMYCGRHRHPEHVNLRARLCESDGCKLRAVFGEVESRQKRFCFAHKQPDDINVNTKACRHPEGCMVAATFGNVTGSPVSCGTHRLPSFTDVRSRSCSLDGCGLRASYGDLHHGALFCQSHRHQSHRNMATQRPCLHPGGCDSPPRRALQGNGRGRLLPLCDRHFELSVLEPLHVFTVFHFQALACMSMAHWYRSEKAAHKR